jgi:hypothetical protein|tara:strand:+ start:111 stop:560 length:450 start_codon:yes stop_codon:yes gene_type:complete
MGDLVQSFSEKCEKLEHALLNIPKEEQAVCPLEHFFAPGIYMRKITMPKGVTGMGHKHTGKHYNIIMRGKVNVMIGEELIQVVKQGDIFISQEGDQKVLHMVEETEWMTVHHNPDDETDIETLEKRYTTHSDTFKEHQKMLEEETCHTG